MNKSNKRKVLFIVSTLGTGGVQKVFANLSIELQQTGLYECSFLLNDTEDIVYSYAGDICSLDVKPRTDRRCVFYQIIVLIRRMVRLKNMKKDKKYDVYISGLTSANFANCFTGNKNCKVITSVHSNMTQALRNSKGISSFIEKIVMHMSIVSADSVVAVSKGVQYDLVTNWGINKDIICQIYNGINVNEIEKKAREIVHFDINKFRYIVAMGRLEKVKGFDRLINAMKLVHVAIPDVKLIILGEGSQRENLKKQITDNGLDDVVMLAGFIENPYPIIYDSELFVCTSLYEGLSNSIIEAMAMQKAVISTDYKYGAREILEPKLSVCDYIDEPIRYGEYGVLVNMYDGANDKQKIIESEIAKSIIKVLTDEVLRDSYGNKALQRSRDFDISFATTQWIKLIKY